jgi:hypothetical protein
MPNQKIPPSFRQKRRLGLIALAPMMATLAMSPQFVQANTKSITATAKYDAKIDKVVVAGKTAKTIAAGAKITAYDASNNIILYSANSNAKNAFSMQLLGTTTVPCLVRLEVTNPQDNSQSQVVLPVKGAAASCKTVPACAITKPAMDTEITAGSSLAFEGAKVKGDSVWSINDGSADEKQASINHSFPTVGKFLVQLTVTDGANQCSDDMTVSVIPPAGTNPNGKVPEEIAPVLGGGMPKGANNDNDALVVFPYEEMGMQGGSQIHLPYNAMINYNSLNAQVIKKVEHKPVLLSGHDVNLVYSAASNAKDPAGKNSINSTSQNLFGQNQVGTNYDTKASTFDATGKPTKNVFIDGQDYRQAKIRKSEQWDRMHQPLAKELGIDETGLAYPDQQNRYAPAFAPALPDQGVRGNSDKALGMREMPGSAAPYVKNDPKKFDYSHEKQNFTAQFLPASDIDDQGRTNPYPLMRVEAKVGNQTVAKTDAVYTTASETRCRECHTPGKIAGDEDVWRMPVTTDELVAPDGVSPGPATGAGSFDPGTDPKKPWPPAIHNKFDDKIADNPAFTNLAKEVNDKNSVVYIERDQNGLRKDRVKESRWVKVDAAGKPTTQTSATKPADADASWKLQVRLNFRESQEEGGNSWVEQEKAALFNTLIMHDYMVYYGPTPAAGKLWPASYSTQVADSYADDKGKSRAQPMYFCSGHHQSSLKFDNGVTARSAQTNRSDYSKAFHAFHGKMQVYKKDVSASESADGLAHKKGDLIRDERGHPKMLGGRGWDSQHNDDNGVPLTADADGNLTKPTIQNYDAKKNNWRLDLFPADKNGELLMQFGEKVPVEENCVKCHTGATEKSYRDIHHTAGLKCDSCHGDMLAVGNVYPNDKYNANLTGGGAYIKESINFRRPWLDNPNCGSCHVGDGNKAKDGKGENFSAGVLRQAWVTGDKSGYSRDPANARFAVMPVKENRLEPATATAADVAAGLAAKVGNTFYKGVPVSQALYRKSADVHGSGANGALACSTCHGGSHAIWPNQDPNANDNQTAKQLQGYDGNIAECSVCHIKDDFKTGLVATDGGTSGLGVGQGVRDGTVVDSSSPKAFLAGPHGMHPIGDESWYFNAVGAAKNTDKGASTKFNGGWHNDFAKKAGPDGEDQCAACHGADHKGTRLSKSLVDRTLTNAKGKAIKVTKGQIIGCDLCHKLDKSFIGSPKGVAKDHPAPKPETFVINTKTVVHTGGGGH